MCFFGLKNFFWRAEVWGMKTISLKIIVILLSAATVWSAELVYHEFKKNETAWFMAQIYFGTGSRYTEILAANDLSSPNQLVVGKKYLIKDPKFSPDSSGFQERFSRINHNRELALAAKTTNGAQEQVAAAVAPTASAPSVSAKKETASLKLDPVDGLLKRFKKSPSALADEELKNQH